MEDKDLTRILEDMVARILAEQNATKKLRKLYVAFDDIWHHENYSLASQLISYKERPVYALVAKPCDSEMERRVKEVYPFLMLHSYDAAPNFTENDCVVLPYIPRHDVIHIALGYSQSYLSEVVKRAFAQGESVYVLPTSIEPLSGKEPIPYQEMVRSYYKRIFELGIQYIDHIRYIN